MEDGDNEIWGYEEESSGWGIILKEGAALLGLIAVFAAIIWTVFP